MVHRLEWRRVSITTEHYLKLWSTQIITATLHYDAKPKGFKKSLRNAVFGDNGEAMAANPFYSVRPHWATWMSESWRDARRRLTCKNLDGISTWLSWAERLAIGTTQAGTPRSGLLSGVSLQAELLLKILVWAKFYSREHCGYSFESIREVLPVALGSVSTVSIHRYYCHSMRILNADSNGLSYGTEEFVEKVYKGRRQVVGRTKWWVVWGYVCVISINYSATNSYFG